MKRLIFLTALLGLGIVAVVLMIRWGLASVPAHADEPPPSSTLAERLTQAESLSTQNKWEEALTVLREVVSRKAEDPALAAEAQCRLGRYRLLMALPKEAEEELRAVASQFPDQTEVVNWSRFFLIDALAFQSNEEGALEVARALVSDQTVTGLQKAWASVRLGGLLSGRGQWGDRAAAATYFKDAHAQAMFANLHGYPLERTRTQIARLAEREGELDTAIAWYRLAITSPGTLPGNESQMADEVARLYRRANRPAEEEAWRVYLLDPRTTPDPTEPITVAVLGAAPQNVIAESVAGGSDRLATLGKFYMSQRRLPEAQGQFEQALQAAANEKQKAEALTGLAYCQRRLQGGEVAL